MATTFRVLSEDDLGEIAFFMQEHELNPNCYVSKLSPIFTIPILRDMVFNGLLYIAGMFEEENLTGITIVLMPSYYANATSATLLFTSLNDDVLGFALSEFTRQQAEHCCTKIKAFVDGSLESEKLRRFFSLHRFVRELKYNEGTNTQIDVFSYIL